jgi:hypothetical protein
MSNNIIFVHKNNMYLQSRVKVRICKKWKEHSERMNCLPKQILTYQLQGKEISGQTQEFGTGFIG